MLYVRAMADYSPEQDPSIPCADAGMSFKKGDVLEVVDQTDALWWQAKKNCPTTPPAPDSSPPPTCSTEAEGVLVVSPYQPNTCNTL
ncbi:hypothetical protein KUCAC02_000906 [Chaenocephalus aceratus]|uniref:Uncharacterized protein n=1 Tax=Chaenocephalus aceratus TaxID=36190 RepID=A0ACB9XX94_CHAAC|nr:hypothetical protein KUCAC02_000906 [Chaenocephalus aceratus]